MLTVRAHPPVFRGSRRHPRSTARRATLVVVEAHLAASIAGPALAISAVVVRPAVAAGGAVASGNLFAVNI